MSAKSSCTEEVNRTSRPLKITHLLAVWDLMMQSVDLGSMATNNFLSIQYDMVIKVLVSFPLSFMYEFRCI